MFPDVRKTLPFGESDEEIAEGYATEIEGEEEGEEEEDPTVELGEIEEGEETDTIKVRKRGQGHLYTSMLQHGGMTIYRGERRLRWGFSLRFLAPVRRFLTKKGVSLAKSLVRCDGPKVMKTVLSTGADLMSGKDVKKTLKRGLRESAEAIASGSREALLDEVNHLKGSGYLMQTGRKSKIYHLSHNY